MNLVTVPYPAYVEAVPRTGRHILAQFDDESVVVYQAYRPSIGRYAASHGRFGGDEFSTRRMSWIKPNFLWMMDRCGWGRKDNQETVLAVRLQRRAFDAILAEAVHSSFVPEVYASMEAWEEAVRTSSVRLQWDPDHDPHGNKLERRAIQLGMRGAVLAKYATTWITAIDDVTPFVHAQRDALEAGELAALHVPRERPYPVRDATVAARLGLSPDTEPPTQ